MTTDYTYFENLYELLPATPDESILSRSVLKNDQTDITLFSFAAGQEMTQHTSGHAAVIHILSGDAEIGLGNDVVKASAGAWIYMPPGLPHALKALTQFTMLLTLYK